MRKFCRAAIFSSVAAGLALSVAGASEPPEPCLSTCMGAMLGASLYDISQATASLKLLNGREDPKLRRLLEWQLVAAIGASRKHVESHPVVDPAALPSLLPNWVNAIERAEAVVTASDLENRPPMPGDASSRHPLENLRVVKAWLALQPSAARSSP